MPFKLPAGFFNAGNLTVIGQFAKTDAAQIKISHVAAFTTTAPTSPHYSG